MVTLYYTVETITVETGCKVTAYKVKSVIKSLQSGAADRSLGFEDEDLRSSPGLLGQ